MTFIDLRLKRPPAYIEWPLQPKAAWQKHRRETVVGRQKRSIDLRHQAADTAFNLCDRETANRHARYERAAAQTQQIANDEQTVGGCARGAIAVDVKQRLNGGEVSADLGCASGGRCARGTCGNCIHTVAEQVSKHHHAIRGWVIAGARATGINVQQSRADIDRDVSRLLRCAGKRRVARLIGRNHTTPGRGGGEYAAREAAWA